MFTEFIEKIHKKNISRTLDKKQQEVNEMYAENGMTEEILYKQAEINRIRNKENITDTTKRTYENFVQ